MTDSEIVIWYRPRVRLWRDLHDEWHLAGEPDGVAKVVAAFRLVARSACDSAEVDLLTDAIRPSRNPVAEQGVSQVYEKLVLERLVHRKGAGVSPVRLISNGPTARLQFSEATKAILGFALLELLDGEGDFNIRVESGTVEPTRLWFWGYSNPHGLNSF